jgi:phosphate:Na+ symporter
MIFLINLLGAAALVLWGLRMVRTGVLRAYGSSLRAGLGRAMGNRFSALLGGLGVTCLLQSSSATALIISSFASRKIVGTTQALAIMLGADLGTSLVAQAYAYRIAWVSPLFILLGWTMFSHLSNTSFATSAGRSSGSASRYLVCVGSAKPPSPCAIFRLCRRSWT